MSKLYEWDYRRGMLHVNTNPGGFNPYWIAVIAGIIIIVLALLNK